MLGRRNVSASDCGLMVGAADLVALSRQIWVVEGLKKCRGDGKKVELEQIYEISACKRGVKYGIISAHSTTLERVI